MPDGKRRRWIYVALLDLQVAAALAFPAAFPYLGPLLWLSAFVGTFLLIWGVRDALWIFMMRWDHRGRAVHGFEHATIAVLEETHRVRIGGTVLSDRGFVVYFDKPPPDHIELVRDAAQRALDRVLRGESHLVYTPDCSTSRDLRSFLFAVALVVPAVFADVLGLPAGIELACIVAALHMWHACHRALGLLAQRYFTVSADLSGLRIANVCAGEPMPEWSRVAVELDAPAGEPAEPLAAQHGSATTEGRG